ncbi:glycosyltransferase family A protein [Christiangramia sp.]|uniref:glycosyltransferase family 2 protein n=1 Tax=Christiangramia sp. TaxID=1931228 RepID=UPI00261BB6DE|nr:glycosyltransferase family A protein [Christiangramia sp.]
MSGDPLFSVIIPVYNRANLISNAINSVLQQSESDWELVIVDDCSTDNIGEVVSNYGDRRIKFIKLLKNKGNAGARNEGIQQSRGQFIFFLDSDDEMWPNTLKTFKERLTTEDRIMFAFGGYQTREKKTGMIRKIFWKPRKGISFLEELKIGTGCGLFVRNDIFEKVGLFDERLRVAVDTDWLIRLDNYKFYPTILDEILVTVNIHSGERVRKDRGQLLKSYEIIFEKNRGKIMKSSSLKRKFFYKLQWLNYHEGNIKKGNNYFNKLISDRIIYKNSILLFTLFNFLNKETAKAIHLKLSGQRL